MPKSMEKMNGLKDMVNKKFWGKKSLKKKGKSAKKVILEKEEADEQED